jgi:nucleoside permease NupC
MIMPLIPQMTTSELHAVLTGGFATMSGFEINLTFFLNLFYSIVLGSILATFIFFGVPANHLIAASVMAAPGALGCAKLLLPETHQSKTTWESVKNTPPP